MYIYMLCMGLPLRPKGRGLLPLEYSKLDTLIWESKNGKGRSGYLEDPRTLHESYWLFKVPGS